jgi:hypothetical protein
MYKERVFPSGQRLVRVHKSGRAYGPLDWNSRISPPGEGGRFDPSPDDPVPYMYGAAGPSAILVAVAGTLRSLAVDAGSGARLLAHEEVDSRALQVFEFSTPVRVIDLTTAEGSQAIGAGTGIHRSRDRSATRSWARYLRMATAGTDIAGIAYSSDLIPDDDGSASVILWGDRIGSGAFVAKGDPVSLRRAIPEVMAEALSTIGAQLD